MKKYLLTVFLFISSPVFAEVPEGLRVFKTQGDLDIVYRSFDRLALICSDPKYHGLFISIIILSALATAFGVAGRGILGKIDASDLIRWICTMIMGVVIYRGLIVPTTEVTIYDDTANQTITVPGVPDLIAFMTNMSNGIEQTIVYIIEASGSPDGYINNPGGVGFNILAKMFDRRINLAGTGDGGVKNKINIDNYIHDCLAFETGRPGTTLTLDELLINSDYNSILAKAVNPIIQTQDAEGTPMSCTEAYATINAYFSLLMTPTQLLLKGR